MIPQSQKKLIRLLLFYGANPNIQEKDGNTPLHVAANPYRPNILEILLKYLANPNIQNLKGRTALHNALGIPKHIELLLAYKANPNIKDKQGRTALHEVINKNKYYAYIRFPSDIMFLLEGGANPYIKDNDGNTVFAIAEENRVYAFPILVKKYAKNTLTKIWILHILNNLSLYEDKLDTLPVELRDKINSLRSN